MYTSHRKSKMHGVPKKQSNQYRNYIIALLFC